MLPLCICLVFIAFLFRMDLRRPGQPSAALWAPFAWMFLAGSRYASSWLSLSQPLGSSSDYAEGSPLDAMVFFSLILTGLVILSKRKVNWEEFARTNIWVLIYFLFCLSSLLWADEPFILFKRWIKDLGNPIMALVILTENRPYEAIAVLLRRLAFMFLPLSLLFIIYFPGLGRSYRPGGSPMYTGIGHQKNDLGTMCLLAGIYVIWELARTRDKMRSSAKGDWIITGILGLMVVYLLRMSDSQTSLVCLVITGIIMALGRMPFLKGHPDRILGLLFGSAATFWALEETFHLKALIFELLNRDPTLTNRTEVWEILKLYEVNAFVGAGFMSFWSGARMEEIWKATQSTLIQAHNGYFEQYLNLGYAGLALLGMLVLSGLVAVRRHMQEDLAAGLLRLSFIIIALFYNTTEASFYGINNMWLLLLLGCLEVPRPAPRRVLATSMKTEARLQPRNLNGHGLPSPVRTRSPEKGRAAAARIRNPRQPKR